MPPRSRSDRGAAAVEYGLLIAGVAGALVLGATGLQAGLAGAYEATSSSIAAVPPVSDATAGSSSPTPTSTSAPAAPAPTVSVAPTPAPTAMSTAAPVPATTSSPAVPSSPAATPTPSSTGPAAQKAAFSVEQDDSVTMDVLASGTSKTGTPSVAPASAGRVFWSGTRLVLAADEEAAPGLVTVTYQYKKGSTVYTATVVVKVSAKGD